MRTRVKFCGLTRLADVDAAVALGVDAIGLVFHPASPRGVDAEQAAALVAAMPAFVTAVGLFVDAEADRIRAVLERVPLGALQFHGHEPADYCRSFGRPWIKSVAVRAGVDLEAEAQRYAGASSLLLDTYDPALAGGTGRRFDWDLVPAQQAQRMILAGGLSAANIAEAIRQLRPYAVDVSGGIEQAKGVKDPDKMTDFMKGVRDGDQS
ncbi:phosphoribosylanthranilate isomerase [Lamprobacter modestohalophilus]|uniref:N-(5'-phosphoribosyl)anthranilate isomerase n=1 Tax=Lamprobacter modestohalophilus TaxID=1064514 RepID=A0A9X0WCY8_9GAMM|nr:phosphoribosylanthranilate isomerase [Lamprobacter modestohalophilus]MBK1621233.1 phosphoribosylanthranilate isomerase [Lamprobacter modestohalophilus]